MVLLVQIWSTNRRQLCACCINMHVASVLWYLGFQRHADKVLQSQILPDSILDFAKDIVIDVSSSDDTDIQWSFFLKMFTSSPFQRRLSLFNSKPNLFFLHKSDYWHFFWFPLLKSSCRVKKIWFVTFSLQ